MAIGTTLKISFDAKSVQRGLAGLKSGLSSIAGIGLSAFKGIAVGATAAAVGITALAVKLNGIGESAISSENRVKNIVKQMGLFGTEADNVSKRLLDFADVSARQLGIDDGIIAMTQAKLSTFKDLAASADVAGGAFDRATMAAIDMAAAGFGTAETNAVQLGKALNDPIKGINSLTRSGITFTTEEKKMIAGMVEMGKAAQAQNIILKAVETQIGGTAAATATASQKINVSLGQLVEAFAKPFSQGFSTLPGQVEGVFSGLVAMAEKFGGMFGNAIADSISGNYDKFITAGKLIGDILSAATEASYQAGIMNLHKGIMKTLEDINPIRRMSEAVGYEGARGSQWETPSFGELLEAHMINRGIKQQAQNVSQGTQGFVPGTNNRFQFAPPGSDSPLTDGNGNRVIEVLSNIEKNTASGAKM
jgi:hypothetical protein